LSASPRFMLLMMMASVLDFMVLYTVIAGDRRERGDPSLLMTQSFMLHYRRGHYTLSEGRRKQGICGSPPFLTEPENALPLCYT